MWFCPQIREMPSPHREQLSACLFPLSDHELSKGGDHVLLCLVYNLACGGCPIGSYAYEPPDEYKELEGPSEVKRAKYRRGLWGENDECYTYEPDPLGKWGHPQPAVLSGRPEQESGFLEKEGRQQSRG